jgi:4-hydroxy-tetrahydrodipicolinate synthase
MKQQLNGTGVALVTPFRGNEIDFPALENIIEHVISGGVDFIVSLGTTGEATTMTAGECKAVLKFTVEKVAGRLPLVAGLFGGNCTERVIERFDTYDLEGFTAVMSSSPAYIKPRQEGIYQHYMKLAERSPLPIIIYNVPGRTASNMTAETTLRLAHATGKFLAVKEASGNINQAMQILKHKPEDFLVFSGDDALTLPLTGAGAHGVISVIANAYPAQFSGMVRAALTGDFQTARHLNSDLLDVHPWLYVDGNPPGIKSAMEILGFCSREVRLPQVPVSERTYLALKKAMEKVPGITVVA